MIQRLLPFLSLIALFVGLSIASPHFLTSTNLSSVVRQTAVINIMALGMTMIIIAGGIDLSVGAILAMGGLLGTMAMEKGCRFPPASPSASLTGLVCGLVNGVLTTQLRIAPFIVTLGTLGIFRGLTLIISNGLPVHTIPRRLFVSGRRRICWACRSCCGCWSAARCLTHVILEHTRLGRYAFAIGSNPEAARLRRSPGDASTPRRCTRSAAC